MISSLNLDTIKIDLRPSSSRSHGPISMRDKWTAICSMRRTFPAKQNKIKLYETSGRWKQTFLIFICCYQRKLVVLKFIAVHWEYSNSKSDSFLINATRITRLRQACENGLTSSCLSCLYPHTQAAMERTDIPYMGMKTIRKGTMLNSRLVLTISSKRRRRIWKLAAMNIACKSTLFSRLKDRWGRQIKSRWKIPTKFQLVRRLGLASINILGFCPRGPGSFYSGPGHPPPHIKRKLGFKNEADQNHYHGVPWIIVGEHLKFWACECCQSNIKAYLYSGCLIHTAVPIEAPANTQTFHIQRGMKTM